MTFTITSQEDIDGTTWPSDPADIFIHNAAGALNFTTLTQATNITAQGCPQLESLDFPVLEHVYIFDLSQIELLSNLSLPALANVSDDETFKIADASSLLNLNLGNRGKFLDISLFSNAEPQWSFFETNFETTQITSAEFIETDYCIDLRSLEQIGTLSIVPWEHCGILFDTLSEAYDISLHGFHDIMFKSRLAINGSLILRNLQPPIESWTGTLSGSSLYLVELAVGQNLTVTSSVDCDLYFRGLTTVGRDMSFLNNTNCTLNFDKLTKARDIYFLDNINTTLPMFPELIAARNIHLRGNIDT